MLAGRVLITGATGFVGRALAPALAARGARLSLAGRDPDRLPVLDGARRIGIGAIGPDTDWTAALDGVEAVVHLAGIAHVPEAMAGGEAAYRRVNRDGTYRLYGEARRAGAARFLFLSSATVLGEGAFCDDASPPDLANAYARSKHEAEQALESAIGGPAVTILRPPLLVGPGLKGNLAALLRVLDTPWPVPLGGIANRRTLLSLANLSAAVEAVLAAPPERARGTFLLGDREPVSTSAIVAALRDGLGRPRRLVRAPQAAIRLAARFAGRPGFARRLLDDAAYGSARFRHVFGFDDRTSTADALVDAGRAWRADHARGATA